MSYIDGNGFDDCNVIFIDGTQDDIDPGIHDMMERMAELYIENYMDPEYLDGLDENEAVIIDYTSLSAEEMRELAMCAATSLELESEESGAELLLS